MSNTKRNLSFLSWGASLAALSVAAHAFPAKAAEPSAVPHVDVPAIEPTGSADSAEPEDVIVVTARRREEKVQDVPIAISIVAQKQLEATGDYTINQVQQLVPSLQVFSFNPRNTNINIRGLGSNVAVIGR